MLKEGDSPKIPEPSANLPEGDDGYLDQEILRTIDDQELEEYLKLWQKAIEREAKLGDPAGDIPRLRKRIEAVKIRLKKK